MMTETQMRANGPAGKFTPFINLLADTLRKKNAAYGDSASQAPMFAPNVSPEEGVWVRLGDKAARLETLLRGGPDNGESINDTLLDLAGYAAILWTLRRPGAPAGRDAAAGDIPKSNQPQSFAPVALRQNESHRDERLPSERPREYSPAVVPPSRSHDGLIPPDDFPRYEVTCRH